MKILHVSDLHLNHDWFDWVTNHCVDFDLLVIAGDLQNAFSSISIQEQVRQVSDWLIALPIPTVVCSGNHDHWQQQSRHDAADPDADAKWLRRLRGRGNVIATDGCVEDVDGLSIAVSGWSQVMELPHRTDILVTHAPPAGCPCSAASGGDCGDPGLYERAPGSFPAAWLLCGHVHEPRRLSCRWPREDSQTLVLVPGCEEGADVPNHWVVNTNSGVAVHNSGRVADLKL